MSGPGQVSVVGDNPLSFGRSVLRHEHLIVKFLFFPILPICPIVF